VFIPLKNVSLPLKNTTTLAVQEKLISTNKHRDFITDPIKSSAFISSTGLKRWDKNAERLDALSLENSDKRLIQALQKQEALKKSFLELSKQLQKKKKKKTKQPVKTIATIQPSSLKNTIQSALKAKIENQCFNEKPTMIQVSSSSQKLDKKPSIQTKNDSSSLKSNTASDAAALKEKKLIQVEKNVNQLLNQLNKVTDHVEIAVKVQPNRSATCTLLANKVEQQLQKILSISDTISQLRDNECKENTDAKVEDLEHLQMDMTRVEEKMEEIWDIHTKLYQEIAVQTEDVNHDFVLYDLEDQDLAASDIDSQNEDMITRSPFDQVNSETITISPSILENGLKKESLETRSVIKLSLTERQISRIESSKSQFLKSTPTWIGCFQKDQESVWHILNK
jgi:hypothetical protein